MQIFDEKNGVLRWKVFAGFQGISPPSAVSLVEVLGYCKDVWAELRKPIAVRATAGQFDIQIPFLIPLKVACRSLR
jgi:hypothetical protein